MEPTDALFNIVEASVALAGFAGLVTALGRRGAGHWEPEDRDRLFNLLLATLFPFASSLLALTLIYAEVASVWRVSSAVLAMFLLSSGVLSVRRAMRTLEASGFGLPAAYGAAVFLLTAVSFMLQLANLARLNTFWPYFAGLAVSLSVGTTFFVRLLWYGIQARRAA